MDESVEEVNENVIENITSSKSTIKFFSNTLYIKIYKFCCCF